MSARRFRPRRRIRSELLTLVAIASLSAAVAGLFPREALVALPVRTEAAPAEAGCAFVTLTEAQEAVALAAARTSWQGNARRLRTSLEMLPSELPQALPAPAVRLADTVGGTEVPRVAPAVRFLPPSVAAPAPQVLAPESVAPPRAPFPREQMLRLDLFEQERKSP